MRVEQRIGRVDRIGGRPLIEVSNYFYRGTVEEQIYRGIGEDYDWFTDVVGPAQPVLAQVERALEDVALEAPGERRAARAQERVAALRTQIEQAKAQAITLGDLESAPDIARAPVQPALGLEGLERVLTTARSTAGQFRAHPSIDGAYLLKTRDGEVAVTFRRTVLDAHAPAVRLLTYLTPEFDQLMRTVPRTGQRASNLEGDFKGMHSLDELDRRLAVESPATL